MSFHTRTWFFRGFSQFTLAYSFDSSLITFHPSFHPRSFIWRSLRWLPFIQDHSFGGYRTRSLLATVHFESSSTRFPLATFRWIVQGLHSLLWFLLLGYKIFFDYFSSKKLIHCLAFTFGARSPYCSFHQLISVRGFQRYLWSKKLVELSACIFGLANRHIVLV